MDTTTSCPFAFPLNHLIHVYNAYSRAKPVDGAIFGMNSLLQYLGDGELIKLQLQ